MSRISVVRIIGSLAVVLATFSSARVLSAQVAAKKLLFFGNSFSQGGNNGVNVPNGVGRIATADGYAAPIIVADLAGGTDVDRHISQIVNSPSLNIASPLIAGSTYDFAVVQGFSTEATHLQSPSSDFIPDMLAISSLIRNQPAGNNTQIVLYETWARSAPHAFYQGANPNFLDPAAMQLQIRDNYMIARDLINDTLGPVATTAPVGDAFEATGFNLALYGSDNYHASNIGYRLSSLVLYRTIYNEMVSDIPYANVQSWAGVSANDWIALTNYADSVSIQAVPEPNTLMLLTTTGLYLTVKFRRFKQKRSL